MGRIVTIGRAMPPMNIVSARSGGGQGAWYDAHTTVSGGRTAGVSAPTREEALEALRIKVAYLEEPEPELEKVEVDW